MFIKNKYIVSFLVYLLFFALNSNSFALAETINLLNLKIDGWNWKFLDFNWDWKNDFWINLNPWNLKSFDWDANMNFDNINKKIIYAQDLKNIEINDPVWYIHSYPEIFVWNKPWWGYVETNSKLPVKFQELYDLKVDVNYNLNFEPWLNTNLAMEWWLTKNQFQTTWIWIWEAEIMVWLYSNWFDPGGEKIWETNINLTVNWVKKTEVFEIYKRLADWETISYRPKNWGWLKANISLNLKQIFDNFKIITSTSNYNDLYFENWEIWTETWNPLTINSKYNWEISKFDVNWILANTIAIYSQDKSSVKFIDLNQDWKNDFWVSLNSFNILSTNWNALIKTNLQDKIISYEQNFTDIVINNKDDYILWYPSIFVWNKPWWWHYVETSSNLPNKFLDLSNFVVDVNYNLNIKDCLKSNLIMQWWLTKNKIETNWIWNWESWILVYLYNNWLNPSWQKVWEIYVDLYINWIYTSSLFEIYKNINWVETISFIPKNNWWEKLI
jgi:hypothetical protein